MLNREAFESRGSSRGRRCRTLVDDSEAADESSSDDDAATKDRGVPGPLRDPLRGDATGVERHRGVERPLGVTGPLRGDAAGRRRRQTRVATGAT